MKSLLRHLAAAVFSLTGVLLASAGTVRGDTAMMTRAGVVFEVSVLKYADVVPSAAGTSDARLPVIALRTTRPGAVPVLELVDGTVTEDEKGSPSIGYDETTDTVFVAYMRFNGLMADVHFAARRAGTWIVRDIYPSVGLYLSLNPSMVVTRQSYIDLDASGLPVPKSRTIVSLVWWEEAGRSQARYAPVFVEDGRLQLDAIKAYNLNELAEEAGPTSVGSLPFSSYQFPTVQRDATVDGGILVSFANLAVQRQSTLRIGFPSDMQQIVASGVPAGPEAYARLHTPVGRGRHDGDLPVSINVSGPVGLAISPTSLVPTFYWNDATAVHVLRGDAPEGTPDTAIPLRQDFSLDRAISVVRESALAD